MKITTTPAGTIPAGWYPDPGDLDEWRYWDGTAWTEARAPRTTTPSLTPPSPELAPPTASSAIPTAVPAGRSPGPRQRWSARPKRQRRMWIAAGAVLVAATTTIALANRSDSNTPVGPNPPASSGNVLGLLGRDASDSAVQRWGSLCGSSTQALGNIMCNNEYGFEIDLDTDMRVTRIVLDSIKIADTQYSGEIPGGLSFSDTYTDVVNRLGEPIQTDGGYGAVSVREYFNVGQYQLTVTFDTWYNRPDYLADAHILSVDVSLA